MRQRDDYFLHLAHDICEKSTMQQKLGAVVVKNKKVISRGYNRWCQSKKLLHLYSDGYHISGSFHAEIDALRKLRVDNDSNLTLYVVRKGFQMAKPCAHCLRAIADSPISRVVFSNNGNFEEIRV